MNLTFVLLTVGFLNVCAKGISQNISFTGNKIPLESVFYSLENQTGFVFIYTDLVLESAKPVTINAQDVPLAQFLTKILKHQPLQFEISGKNIFVSRIPPLTGSSDPQIRDTTGIAFLFQDSLITIYGQVVDEKAEPVVGANVVVKGAKRGTTTGANGKFNIDADPGSILIISSVGYETLQYTVLAKNSLTVINLIKKISSLNEVVINKGYYSESQNLSTGNVGKIKSADITNQPVSNPLAALEGRVPGLVVTQTSGVAGGKFKVEIRGRNSLIQGSEPLFVVDGVPFAANNNSLNQLTSALASYGGQGLSPFNTINPADIESIEILKDADATSIYGSRGANGVVLITTKKGKPGKTSLNVNFYSGISKVTRTADMMNSQQYLQMRLEAFKNDGAEPDEFSAPDLLLWDTTRYTDFKKLFIDGTAHVSDAQVSVSGGNANTKFLISGGYHYESSVFSEQFALKRGSMHFDLDHITTNKKFKINLVVNYSSDDNEIPSSDMTSYLTLPPVFPSLYDSAGKLNWQAGGVAFDNPMAILQQKYYAKTDNLLSNLQLSYKIINGLTLKASFGYNTIFVDEWSAVTKSAQNPQFSPAGSASFATNGFKSWIVEPQIDYAKSLGKSKFSVLIGSTWQQIINSRSYMQGFGYSNDALLKSISGASFRTVSDDFNQYRYNAFFGRFNYNWNDKYVINITGRRDGSSRFGPDKRFANFGAGGVAWIFSNENFMKTAFPFISYAKLRASFGAAGNDQIGDYQYLDVWRTTSYSYQGASVVPVRLFNPDYGWEINKKLEIGIELGFIDDNILLSFDYFRNRSSNQLVSYTLPGQTGFTSITRNFPALIQNQGFEFSISAKNILKGDLHWSVSANLTLPSNKLVSFPGLSSSPYAYSYVEGRSLNFVYSYHLLGVDPASGIYMFEDVDKDGATGTGDYVASYNLDPKFYGGVNNTFNYKNWELLVFFVFKKQIGLNYRNYPVYNFSPGGMYNLPEALNNRWQKPGDNTNTQQFTQTYTPAFDAQYNFSVSDGIYSDASYARLKNASLSYNISEKHIKAFHFSGCRIYFLGQNLLTITDYQGSDPETQNLFVLPPLKTFTAGIQLTF